MTNFSRKTTTRGIGATIEYVIERTTGSRITITTQDDGVVQAQVRFEGKRDDFVDLGSVTMDEAKSWLKIELMRQR